MKFRNLLLPLLAVGFAIGVVALGQDSHVRSEYMPKIKMTKVETDMLFVSNTPEQFMQIGFVARYPTAQLVTPPKNITVTLFSNSPKPLYESNQKLVAVTDGDSWKVGDLTYWLGQGSKTDKGQEMFASEKRPGLGLQNPLPPHAMVAQNRHIEHLYLEWLFIELKPDQFAKMVHAHNLGFQIGRTEFQFTEDQMNTVRAFAGLVTPK